MSAEPFSAVVIRGDFLDAARAPMYVADASPERNIHRISKGLANLLEYPSPQSISMDAFLRQHVHTDDFAAQREAWARFAVDGNSSSSEYRLVKRSGVVCWVHEESMGIGDSRGEQRYVLGFLNDITDRVHDAETLGSYARDLRERVKELDCLYSITHLAEEGTVDQILERVVPLLPRAWQYADRAYARIVFEGREFCSDSPPPGAWNQRADIVIHGTSVGLVEIGYRSWDESKGVDPFLPEEWSLLKGIARRLADTIERRRSEEALRRSEELYRTLAKNVPNAFVGLFDTALRCTLAEGVLRNALSKQSVEGQLLSEIWSKDLDFLLHSCRLALEGKENLEERRWNGLALSIHTLPIVTGCGVSTGMFLVQDVTNRRTLEKEVLEIAGREQRRFGQDLHDGLGQMLTGLMCLSGSLVKNLEQAQSPYAADAAEFTEIVRHAMTELRLIARGVMPVDIDPRGLATALDEFAYDCENMFNIVCEFKCNESVRVPDPVAATQLYRIVQEAVNNAVRHGRASHVSIVLEQAGMEMGRLVISDNGTGFDVQKQPSSGMGMRIMRYRVETIGGSLDVHSQSGKGTRIECRIPLVHAADSPRGAMHDDRRPSS
jgi:signal transduction histidine kinase